MLTPGRRPARTRALVGAALVGTLLLLSPAPSAGKKPSLEETVAYLRSTFETYGTHAWESGGVRTERRVLSFTVIDCEIRALRQETSRFKDFTVVRTTRHQFPVASITDLSEQKAAIWSAVFVKTEGTAIREEEEVRARKDDGSPALKDEDKRGAVGFVHWTFAVGSPYPAKVIKATKRLVELCKKRQRF